MHNIEDLERLMITDGVQVECTLKHYFSEGVYIREITIPTGTVLLGATHTTTHLNMLSKGKCTVVDTITGHTQELEAPYTYESLAGVRKLFYVHEEVVWSTIHPTKETDIDKLESELIELSNTYIELKGKKLLT